MTTNSLRHPDMSLDDMIAAKLCAFVETMSNNRLTASDQEGFSKEIVGDMKELFAADYEARLKAIEDKLFPPPSVLDEKDLRIDVYTGGGWGIDVRHVPSGIVVNRTSEDGFRSQLQAKADAMLEMEGKVRKWLSR